MSDYRVGLKHRLMMQEKQHWEASMQKQAQADDALLGV